MSGPAGGADRPTGPPPGDDGPADGGFRLFPSGLDDRRRRVYLAVLVFYLAATVGLVWPVYAAFGGIRPTVLGIPFSLLYVVLWVVASFLVLLALFLWEGRRDDAAPEGGGAPRADPADPRAGG